MAYTTIQITKETRAKLSKLKAPGRGTYDELLEALLSLIPSGDDEGEYSDEFKASMLRALADIKYGRTYSMQEAKKILGV